MIVLNLGEATSEERVRYETLYIRYLFSYVLPSWVEGKKSRFGISCRCYMFVGLHTIPSFLFLCRITGAHGDPTTIPDCIFEYLCLEPCFRRFAPATGLETPPHIVVEELLGFRLSPAYADLTRVQYLYFPACIVTASERTTVGAQSGGDRAK